MADGTRTSKNGATVEGGFALWAQELARFPPQTLRGIPDSDEGALNRDGRDGTLGP